MDIKVTLKPKEKRNPLPKDESQLGFGKIFTDHMFLMEYKNGQWQNAQIKPFENFSISPAALVFHYGQEIFEGMKAYKQVNKKDISLFRPEKNANRMIESAIRVDMAPFPENYFVEALQKLIAIEKEWVPNSPGTSLYVRPTMIATEVGLGLRSSKEYYFFVILSPVGSYFPEGFKPVKIYVEPEYVRAAKGGIGESKTGGNYAASLMALKKAFNLKCSQVMWLDAVSHKYVEEVGQMNQFFVIDDVIYTSPLTGTILKGVTRESVITLAKDKGYKLKEELITIDKILETIKSGNMTEAFGSGTAATIASVGELIFKGKNYVINNNKIGPITQELYNLLTGIQCGKIPDPYGWNVKIKL